MELNNRLLLKVIELGLCIASVIFSEVVGGSFTGRPVIVYGTIAGYTVICAVLLAGHILNSTIEKRINALFSLIGCILFIVSGALVIDEWHDSPDILYKETKRNALAAGSLMIINGAVFLLDTLSICKS
ncbi:protein snakeskin [Episyrphus balteatus]|uniref:protein snakeskin n=1 Tax=Episyrphus balteatus TaxID=286459 RepID=UPI002486A886|nr:protein snakeskin [Episyrphus balteatus]